MINLILHFPIGNVSGASRLALSKIFNVVLFRIAMSRFSKIARFRGEFRDFTWLQENAHGHDFRLSQSTNSLS